MATKTYAKIAPLFAKGVQTYQWSGMATGDDGLPALDVMRHTKKTLQAEGTVTSVPIQGRIDGGAWVTLVTLTTAGIIDIPQDVDDIRPVVTTGAAVIITLQVVAPSRALSGTTSLGGLVPLPGGGFSFPTGQILAPDGTEAAPSYSFASLPGLGMYKIGGAGFGFAYNGSPIVAFNYANTGTIHTTSSGGLYWSNSPANALSTQDLILTRDAAGILALKNGANPQTFRVYGDYTDVSNYARFSASVSIATNRVRLLTESAGAGVPLHLALGSGGTDLWLILTDGSFAPLASYDLGHGGYNFRVRTVYLDTSINFTVPTVPSTPSAGQGVLYMKADKKLYFKNDAGVETALF